LRNGEQFLLLLVLPALALVALALTHAPDLGAGRRIDVAAPGVLALAIMSTAFTGQAIGTGFDRRSGVLRLPGTPPLGPRRRGADPARPAGGVRPGRPRAAVRRARGRPPGGPDHGIGAVGRPRRPARVGGGRHARRGPLVCLGLTVPLLELAGVSRRYGDD